MKTPPPDPPFVARRSCVQPAGSVVKVMPPVTKPIEATMTSPSTTPAGLFSVNEVALVATFESDERYRIGFDSCTVVLQVFAAASLRSATAIVIPTAALSSVVVTAGTAPAAASWPSSTARSTFVAADWVQNVVSVRSVKPDAGAQLAQVAVTK